MRSRSRKAAGAAAAMFMALTNGSSPRAHAAAGLQLEAKIPLGAVSGRIDHMAADLQRGRLIVAELGNNSVAIVDVKNRKVVHRIVDLKEPQGVAYVTSSDTLYVANAQDGSVRLYHGADYVPAGEIALGTDADNIRLNAAGNEIVVGYGNGGLAVIATNTGRKIADIPLKGHPEGFRLHTTARLIFANIPDSHIIAVVDRAAGKQIAAWPMTAGGNFPMALNERASQVVVAFRQPPLIRAFAMQDGRKVANASTCGDADDVFVDSKRRRLYVSCGEGAVDIFDIQADAYRRIERLPTVAGARTSLFVPEWDRLFVAAPAQAGEAAAIWVLRPRP